MARVNMSRPLALAALVISLAVSQAAGFQLGYHIEITRDALAKLGLDRGPATVVQLANAYDDMYGSAEEVIGRLGSEGQWWGGQFGPGELRTESVDYLHFCVIDPSGSTPTCSRCAKTYAEEWDRLVKTTHAAVTKATQPIELLVVLGMTVHTVQDFYAHSNWVDLPLAHDIIWFDLPAGQRDHLVSPPDQAALHRRNPDMDFAGMQGSTVEGFGTAYREAFYATYHWARLVQSWAPDLWRQAESFVSAGADEELPCLEGILKCTGQWKSQWQLDLGALPDVMVPYLNYQSHAVATEVMTTWRSRVTAITGPGDQAANPPTFAYRIPTYPWLNATFHEVRQTDNDDVWDIDPNILLVAQADFFPVVRTNGTVYCGPIHLNADRVAPVDDWLVLSPLSPMVDKVGIVLEVWDDDGLMSGSGDPCDIDQPYHSRVWSATRSMTDLGQGVNVSTNGFNQSDWWRDGDGDEAACSFTLKVDSPTHTQLNTRDEPMNITRPPRPKVWATPSWTNCREPVHVQWRVDQPTGSAPISGYRWRMTDASGSTPWKIEQPEVREAEVALDSALEGESYVFEVQADSAGGWSETGTSDPVRIDRSPPTLSISAIQQIDWSRLVMVPEPSRGGVLQPGTAGSVHYPNSLSVALQGQDPPLASGAAGSGLANYRFRLATVGPVLDRDNTFYETTVACRDVADGLVKLIDLPFLYQGGNYCVTVEAEDWAGNSSAPASGWCGIAYVVDSTTPPAPKCEGDGVTVGWGALADSESGIATYLLAGSDSPDADVSQLEWSPLGHRTYLPPQPAKEPSLSYVWLKSENGRRMQSPPVGPFGLRSVPAGTPDIDRLVNPKELFERLGIESLRTGLPGPRTGPTGPGPLPPPWGRHEHRGGVGQPGGGPPYR